MYTTRSYRLRWEGGYIIMALEKVRSDWRWERVNKMMKIWFAQNADNFLSVWGKSSLRRVRYIKVFGVYCAKKAVNTLYNKYSSATNNFLPDRKIKSRGWICDVFVDGRDEWMWWIDFVALETYLKKSTSWKQESLNISLWHLEFNRTLSLAVLSGNRTPVGMRFFLPVHTGPEARTDSCTML